MVVRYFFSSNHATTVKACGNSDVCMSVNHCFVCITPPLNSNATPAWPPLHAAAPRRPSAAGPRCKAAANGTFHSPIPRMRSASYLAM